MRATTKRIGVALITTVIILLLSGIYLKYLQPDFYSENKKTIAIIFGIAWIFIGSAVAFLLAALSYVIPSRGFRYLILYIVYLFFIIIIFADIYSEVGITYKGELTNDFFVCLYFSIVTLTTLGYGDAAPTRELLFVAAGEAFIGYLLLAILVAILIDKFRATKAKALEDYEERLKSYHQELREWRDKIKSRTEST